MNFQELLKSKTFWTGVAGVITAASGYFTGAMSASAAAMSGLGSLLAIFLKDALVTQTKELKS